MYSVNVRNFESEEVLGKTSALGHHYGIFQSCLYSCSHTQQMSFATEQPFLQIYCPLFIGARVADRYLL